MDTPDTTPAGTTPSGDPTFVREEQRGPVLTLTLDSPGNRNALSASLLDQLAAGIDRGTEDDSVRVIVLTGDGPAFCSGADLAERLNPPPVIPGVGANMPHVMRSMAQSPKPIIARVNGHVRGGGVGLVATCDLAVAAAGTTFAFSEVRVGVVPAMIAPSSQRAMSASFLSRYMLTGESFGVDEAVSSGLLSGAVADGAGLDPWVDGVIGALLKGSPRAIGTTKLLLHRLRDETFEDGLKHATVQSEEVFTWSDAAAGMEAFLYKRPAPWVVEPPARS